MTIIGIGIDIVEIKRIKIMMHHYPHQLPKKILSANEYMMYVHHHNKCNFLAKVFAIKESASKALGTGISQGISFYHFETYNNNLGAPKLKLLKNALKISKKLHIRKNHVSVTNEKKYLCAITIFEN
ncbi:4'-phosphopantetheinyl transferase [Buchnera aphidicola (Nipponaphis monzeni)]|uniref:Holo-[acyl-carrier-protein] synthase n=1 Tax=Buchnera aphidicola (Nipponaphis monzeni) TaxID=2495405 RepID=A0A455TA57_9GAMM|nr:holo-ACP synthase [Buchnera aphidicola]BBI01213.1 4'-phosphopantetheinyl transferase [Buchnera aphidicola (Nipponaphis monzeni)]